MIVKYMTLKYVFVLINSVSCTLVLLQAFFTVSIEVVVLFIARNFHSQSITFNRFTTAVVAPRLFIDTKAH